MIARSKAVTGVMVMSVLATAILCYGLLATGTESSNLQWGVQVGDRYLYEIHVFGHNVTRIYNPGNDSYSETDATLLWSPMNNTRIYVTVSHLPVLPSLVDAETFADDIINYQKTEVEFENGSALPPQFSMCYVDLTSRTFLPTGNWTLLDALYQDSSPDPPFMKTWYLSVLDNASFYLGYTLYGPDYADGWGGNVTLTTGVPLSSRFWAWDAIEHYQYVVELELIQ